MKESPTEQEHLIPSADAPQSSGTRIAVVLVLTLLPWPAVWFGMYKLYSIVWTFFLYHVVCLLPAIIWGYPLWRPGIKWPTRRQAATLIAAATISCISAFAAYMLTGSFLIDKTDLLKVLSERGYQATWILPLSVYFVVINATAEELFWRGVVLNELKPLDQKLKLSGYIWTACTFAAWHYLVFKALLRPGWAELCIALLVLVGAGISELYKRTGSILLAILWHALVLDLSVIAVFLAVQSY